MAAIDIDFTRRNKKPRPLSEQEKEKLDEFIEAIHYSARYDIPSLPISPPSPTNTTTITTTSPRPSSFNQQTLPARPLARLANASVVKKIKKIKPKPNCYKAS